MTNPPELHSSIVSTAALVVTALESYGLESATILKEAGFDTDKIYSPSGRISSRKLEKLWKLAVQHSRDPCFGLTYASYIQPSALHGLGFSWLASHSLKEGLARLVRYQRIIATDLKLEMRETGRGYCIYDAVGQNRDPFDFPDAAYDSTLASIYKISCIMLGPEITPVAVTFEHSRPSCASRLERFFRVAPEYDAGETAITFDRDMCNAPAPSGNPELARINDHIVISYLNQFDESDIVTQTMKYIIDHLPSGVPKQSLIARDLNLSLRNFQRKLSSRGTSYAELLNQTRHNMARQYLKSPEHQIIQVAYMLGYTDPSNFARAFKRWNGRSPNQYRQDFIKRQMA